MSSSTLWWIIGGVLVAAELATGTFYLLMLALGAVAAAIAAMLGAGETLQLLAAAVVGGGAVIAWHQKRGKRPDEPAAGSNPNVNMDVGQTVQVAKWAVDGSATIKYRGADWRARYVGEGPPATGSHVIRAVEGSILLLDR